MYDLNSHSEKLVGTTYRGPNGLPSVTENRSVPMKI